MNVGENELAVRSKQPGSSAARMSDQANLRIADYCACHSYRQMAHSSITIGFHFDYRQQAGGEIGKRRPEATMLE
jgi:hypothetical protein